MLAYIKKGINGKMARGKGYGVRATGYGVRAVRGK
jgi:hypothetical protein